MAGSLSSLTLSVWCVKRSSWGNPTTLGPSHRPLRARGLPELGLSTKNPSLKTVGDLFVLLPHLFAASGQESMLILNLLSCVIFSQNCSRNGGSAMPSPGVIIMNFTPGRPPPHHLPSKRCGPPHWSGEGSVHPGQQGGPRARKILHSMLQQPILPR